MPGRELPSFTLSNHARSRLFSRGVSMQALRAALRWGRRIRSHGDHCYRLDRRSVARARRNGVRVDAHEGTTVILTQGGVVRTIWRNRSPRRVRR